jgi:hypothetical protein
MKLIRWLLGIASGFLVLGGVVLLLPAILGFTGTLTDTSVRENVVFGLQYLLMALGMVGTGVAVIVFLTRPAKPDRQDGQH